jgi:hypothetical protein
MGGACSTCGRDEMLAALQLKDLKGRNHLRDLSIHGKINIEVYIIGYEAMDWVNIDQHKVQC